MREESSIGTIWLGYKGRSKRVEQQIGERFLASSRLLLPRHEGGKVISDEGGMENVLASMNSVIDTAGIIIQDPPNIAAWTPLVIDLAMRGLESGLLEGRWWSSLMAWI
jgi:hypothetical protein